MLGNSLVSFLFFHELLPSVGTGNAAFQSDISFTIVKGSNFYLQSYEVSQRLSHELLLRTYRPRDPPFVLGTHGPCVEWKLAGRKGRIPSRTYNAYRVLWPGILQLGP